MSDYKYTRLLKDTVIFALGNLGSKLILFFMVPLYTNFMTTEEYGISDFVSTLVELLVPFVSLVIFDAVQRFALAKDEHHEDVLLSGLVVSSAGSLFLFVLTPLFRFYGTISPWRWFLSIYVVLTVFANVEKNYLKAKEMNRLFALLSIVQTAALASCNVVFLCYQDLGIVGYLLSTCISCLVPVIGPLLFGGLISDLRKAKFDSSLTIRMLIFSAPLTLNNVSWWAIHSFDKVLLEVMLGAEALGIYGIATKMPSLVNVVTSVFSQAWGISSVREFETENDTGYYSSVLRLLIIAVFGITIVLTCVMRNFLSFYVAPSFWDAWRYTPLLLVGAAFNAVSSYYGCMYGALKKSVNNMLTTLLSSLVCLLTTTALVPQLHIWGAVVGTYLAYLVLLVARVVDLSRYIDVDYGSWRLWTLVIVITVHAILVSIEIEGIVFVNAIVIVLYLFCNLDLIQGLYWRMIGR